MIFTPVIVRHRKLIFFRFSIFSSKTSRQSGLKFLEIKAIYILHYYDFFQKVNRLVWEF